MALVPAAICLYNILLIPSTAGNRGYSSTLTKVCCGFLLSPGSAEMDADTSTGPQRYKTVVAPTLTPPRPASGLGVFSPLWALAAHTQKTGTICATALAPTKLRWPLRLAPEHPPASFTPLPPVPTRPPPRTSCLLLARLLWRPARENPKRRACDAPHCIHHQASLNKREAAAEVRSLLWRRKGRLATVDAQTPSAPLCTPRRSHSFAAHEMLTTPVAVRFVTALVRASPEHRRSITRASSEHRRSIVGASSEQRQSSVRSPPGHHQSSARAAPEQHQSSVRVASEQRLALAEHHVVDQPHVVHPQRDL